MSYSTILRGREVTALTAGLILVCTLFFGAFLLQRNLQYQTLSQLEKKFVPGFHGVILIHPDHAERPSFEPWQPLEQNRALEGMLSNLCRAAGAEDTCAADEGVRFELFTKEHRVGDEVVSVRLVRGAVPVDSVLTSDFLDTRLALMGEWARANQQSNGSLPYLYHPSRGDYPEGGNVIRYMITVQGLYALGNSTNDASVLQVAKRAEAYAFASSYVVDLEKGYAYMKEEDGTAKLGATALAVLALREGIASQSPLSVREKLLGEYLLAMQREDGSFQTFLHDENSIENDRFYSGEALTALAVLARNSTDGRYEAALARSFPYYRTMLGAEWYPQYAPWHMQAYTILYEIAPSEEYAAYVYSLADQLIETMLGEDEEALADEIGRFYNPNHPEWGPPHSSSTGIYTEGLTYALELALLRGDTERVERYRTAILVGSRALLALQWTPESAYYLEHPERVVGALKRSITDNRHRVDQIGHAVNALVRVRTIVFAD